MPLFSDHISNMYYSGTPSYTGVPYGYSSSVSPLGSSYSASYLNPGGSYSNHSSLGNYSRAPLTSRWISSVGRSYSPMLGTISERSTASPVRINSPRRIPITKRSYASSGYILRPININTADIDVSRDKYRPKVESPVPSTSQQRENSNTEKENGPFMPRVDGKPDIGIDSSPGIQRSTIKRGRTVVRFHTLRRKERDSPRKHAEVSPNEDTIAPTLAATNETKQNKKEEPTESTSWRERLSEDLVYKDKKEKKTLGAKLVEKFILKDIVDKDVETVSTQSSNEIEVSQNFPETLSPNIDSTASKSLDRRCSMELLAEQAQLLDSLIRRENLSTATLDLSKVGVVNELKNNVKSCGPLKMSKTFDHENPLKTTKSDYSLHKSLNLFDDKKISKKRSLKKSFSGGSICRLDSITEFPREPININLPATEENRHLTKQDTTKLKPKPKLKAKITTSVEVTTPKSPLKFRIENVIVEEKPRVLKKEITYSSEVHETPTQNNELEKSKTSQCTIPEHISDKEMSKNGFINEFGIPSPESDDGNFWNKIGKRETVYLMKRKQNLEETKEKHKRALYWFPEEDDSSVNNECNEPSSESLSLTYCNESDYSDIANNVVRKCKSLEDDVIADTNNINEQLTEADLPQKINNNKDSQTVDSFIQLDLGDTSALKGKQSYITETRETSEHQSTNAEVAETVSSSEVTSKDVGILSSSESNSNSEKCNFKTQTSKGDDGDEGQVIASQEKEDKINTYDEIKKLNAIKLTTESNLLQLETQKINAKKDVSEMTINNNVAIENSKVEFQNSEIAKSNQIKVMESPKNYNNNFKMDNKSAGKKIDLEKAEQKLPQSAVQENIVQTKVSEKRATLEEKKLTESIKQNAMPSLKMKAKQNVPNVKNLDGKKMLEKKNTPESNQKDNNETKKITPKKDLKANSSNTQKLKESVDSENMSRSIIQDVKNQSLSPTALSTNKTDKTTAELSATQISINDQTSTPKCTDIQNKQLTNSVPSFDTENLTITNSVKNNNVPEISVAVESNNIPVKQSEDKTNCQDQSEEKTGEVHKPENITKEDEQEHKQKSIKEITQELPAQSPRKPAKIQPAIRPLIATPRPLQKKPPQVIHSSDSSDSSSEEDSSDEDDASETSEDSAEFLECETNPDGRTSTGSNDSGFDSSAPTSPSSFLQIKKDCDVNCHRKCEKLTANLCGVNQRLLVEALATRTASKKGGDNPGTSSSSATTQNNSTDILEQELEQSTAYGLFRKTGRFTPPARSIPRFRKYTIEDFQFIKVLGKGSFGKVLLAELRDTEYYYAVKCLKKDVVLEDDDVECTLIERKVLALGTNHPYLCHLFATFQTDSHLFFVMEYLNGGDLMFHIQQSGRFPEVRARFYAAEIVSGLKFLHKRGIIYRDLKLDNILLDFDGHVRIADFGMCKLQIYLDKTADTFCGTPDYMAPEIIKGLKYNQTVDWWSFGVLLYEMLIGQSPFSGCDEDELFWSICNEMPSYPRFLSQQALTILTRLLDKDARSRLGGTECMHGDIREQEFFQPIHWDRLERRELEAPFRPRVRHPLDTQYFDRAFTGERPRLTAVEPQVLRSMDQEPFRGFSYTNPNATDR